MAIDLLADEPIDLLADEEKQKSFEDLSPEEQEKALQLAKEQIATKHPNMPDWLRDMILQVSPKNASPMLGAAARGVSNVTDYIPAAAGGALQGASIPIRGIAGLIPTDFTQKLANSPDLTKLFPKANGPNQENVQLAAELLGGGGIVGKLFKSIKGASELAKIPKALQTPTSLAATGAIATPGDVTNRELGAAGALAAGGLGNVAGKVAKKVEDKLPAFLRGLTSKSTPEALVEAVQKPHDKLLNTADELYGQVRSAINKRNISIPVNEEYLNHAAEILPKTRASRQLIDKARSGDYEAVHKLQSHLFQKGTKAISSDDIALENQGEEILDLRNKINDDLENHLIKEGHIDIAHVLKQGKKAYKQIMDTYYAKHLRKGIGKMVHNELRLVPENPEKLLTENSVPMKTFLAKHPEAAKHAQGLKEKEQAIKKLKHALVGTGVGGGAAAGLKSLYDLSR